VDDDELCRASAAEQVELVRSGAVSARELTGATLRRIETLDPTLNAFRVVFDERALDEADRIDRRREPDDRPLLGVPVAIKDDTDVAGHITAWGSAADGDPAEHDAVIVHRLRAAGAIIIGKTHVPQLCLWPWTTSAAWGPTRNPWDPERTPGGSSGGSAAAVAAGLCAIATGSDGGGSIRYPAALTGLFGLKPQRDRIRLDAGHSSWHGLLTLGALTRTVHDTARFLDATADDPPDRGYTRQLDPPRRRLRIAVSLRPPARSFARLGDEQRHAVDATADLLRDLGHHVFEQQIDYGDVMANTTIRYVAGAHADASTHAGGLERTTRRVAAIGARIPRRTLARALHTERTIAARINEVFRDADLVLTPMVGSPAPRLADLPRGALRSLQRSNVDAWANPWNVIGQPAASIPAGLDRSGLPLAVQLGAPPDGEPALLNLAAQLQAARPWPPTAPSP
jgi:amidase